MRLKDKDTVHSPELESSPEALEERPDYNIYSRFSDKGLYRYSGTNVYQWYVKRGVYWSPIGEFFTIGKRRKS